LKKQTIVTAEGWHFMRRKGIPDRTGLIKAPAACIYVFVVTNGPCGRAISTLAARASIKVARNCRPHLESDAQRNHHRDVTSGVYYSPSLAIAP